MASASREVDSGRAEEAGDRGQRHDRPSRGRSATEDDAFNWGNKGGGYIRSRVEAENLVLNYARNRGLPAVALCVSNTYGRGEWQPTPHGWLAAVAAAGRMGVYVKGASEAVGVEDAATALVLAADNGRNGERYIVSERFVSSRELHHTAANAVGAKRPRFGIPLKAMYVLGLGGDIAGAVLRRDMKLSTLSVRLMHITGTMDHGKAEREVGWRPTPVYDSIRRAAHFHREHRRPATS